MNAWLEFCKQYSTASVLEQDTVCALPDHGLLYVGGDDATEFLQNQLSNDINQTSAARAQLSSFSNAKGRMLAIFRVIAIDGGYLLFMPRAIIAEVQVQLQMYVLRSQVVLADITESFAMLGVCSQAGHFAGDDRFPDEVHKVYQSDSLISLRVHAGQDQARYLIMSNDETEAKNLWQDLTTSLSPGHPDSWRLQEIQAGVPSLYPATMGAFVLQMTNLQSIDGVNFKKGCYPGQEVVARMQYLGKLKRRMYRATAASDQCPAPGSIVNTGNDPASEAGKVVDAVPTAPDQCDLLLVARIDAAETGALALPGQPLVKLDLHDLPYAVAE